VFARGFLKLGHPVVPVTRAVRVADALAHAPEPELVLVAVGEDDLAPALAELPTEWRSRVGLLQNELLPEQWTTQSIVDPTVAIVWFEKKPGREVVEVRPTLVSGPREGLVVEALRALGISARPIDPTDLHHELVVKNLYILTLNLAGLETRGTAGELLDKHRALFDRLVPELIRLERSLLGDAGARLDDARLVRDLEASIQADPAHGCAGRSAPRRLERSLAHARRLGVTLPELERLAESHAPSS
jgi:hypothetical protein